MAQDSDSGGLIALAQDYDASQDTYSSSPIQYLSGTIEGLGHAIINLTVVAHEKCVGLVSYPYPGSVIRDIRLPNVNISATHDPAYVGSVEGCGDGIIQNASAQGVVTGPRSSTIGGLQGTGDGVINSSADVNVFANSGLPGKYVGSAGGLVGWSPTLIVNSHATGRVMGDGLAGGIAGAAVRVVNSYATGQISTGDTDHRCTKGRYSYAAAGGLVGGLGEGNTITGSFATGAVSGGQNAMVGGLVGESSVYNKGGDVSTIENSYSTGSVQGETEGCFGGLAGRAATVQTSYSVGHVGGSADGKAGALVGVSETGGHRVQDYWDLDTSGQTQGCGGGSCSGVTGLTDAQLESALPAGFDPAVWRQKKSINNGYPYLLANPPPE